MALNTEDMRERISREATDWLILLQDAPDDADLQRRFRLWLSESDAHAAAWQATQRTAAAIAATASHRMTGFERTAVGIAGAHRPARRVAWRQVGIAAAAACLAIVFAPAALLHLQADQITDATEIRQLRLQDGSQVTLAPGSAVAMAFSDGARHVDLLSGQAFFEVTPNPASPFMVRAGDVQTIVTGTRFDIRHDGRAVAVAVQEGSVRVGRGAAGMAETLSAGQGLSISATGNLVRSQQSPALVAAWRQGQLIAQDQPMGEIVNQMRRHYAGTIIMTDAALAARPVTGVYNLADPVDALRGIATAHKAVLRQITPWILVISAS